MDYPLLNNSKMQTTWNPPEIRKAVARMYKNNVVNLITRVTPVAIGTHIETATMCIAGVTF